MYSSSEDVDMKPEITGNVYEYVDSPKYSFLISLEEGVLKKVTANDYEWNMHYAISYGSKVQITAKFLSRYVFDDKVFLIVNAEQSGHNNTKEFELDKKMDQEQVMVLDLIKQEEGFNAHIKVTFELVIKDIDYIGIVNSSIAFNSPSRPHDALILVDSEKFYVQKRVLANWSKYFKDLFFGASARKDQKEFRVAGCNSIEFLALLQVIHPSTKEEINEVNIASLMMMAEKFDMPGLEIRCGNYLMDFENCGTITLMNRLRVSDQMKHATLQVACLKKIRAMDPVDFKQFFDENSAELKNLSNTTVRNLL